MVVGAAVIDEGTMEVECDVVGAENVVYEQYPSVMSGREV